MKCAKTNLTRVMRPDGHTWKGSAAGCTDSILSHAFMKLSGIWVLLTCCLGRRFSVTQSMLSSPSLGFVLFFLLLALLIEESPGFLSFSLSRQHVASYLNCPYHTSSALSTFSNGAAHPWRSIAASKLRVYNRERLHDANSIEEGSIVEVINHHLVGTIPLHSCINTHTNSSCLVRVTNRLVS